MLLETLLLSPCFLLGNSTIKDGNVNFNIDKSRLEPDEILLIFDIDDQTEHNCECGKKGSEHRKLIRKLFWEDQQKRRLCDLLIFYAKDNKRVFCFIELKENSNDFEDAKDQLISTYNAFKMNLAQGFETKYTAKAFICYFKGGLPTNHKKYQDELNAKFGDKNCKNNGTSAEFLAFLRGDNKKFEKKGKKK